MKKFPFDGDSRRPACEGSWRRNWERGYRQWLHEKTMFDPRDEKASLYLDVVKFVVSCWHLSENPRRGD
jgi:hypothetical protein